MPTTLDVQIDRPYIPTNERSSVFADVTIDPGSKPGTATRQVVICIDRSGSMKGDPISNAKDGASNVLGLLNDDDQIGVVSFSSAATTNLQMGKFGDHGRSSIESAIQGISPSGGTDIYNALEQSQDMLQNLSGDERTSKRILLLTDGSDNKRDAPQFESLATDIGNNGISIVSAGLGNYDQQTVKTIGESSQGSWDHLQDPNEILNFFGDAISDAGKTMISNPQVRIEGVQGLEVINAHRRLPQVQEVTLHESNEKYIVRLPDLLNREKQQVMFELEAPARDEGKVKLADINLDAGTESKSEQITTEYTSDNSKLQQRQIDVWAKFQDAEARTKLANAETEMDVKEAEQQTELVEGVAGDTQIADDLRDDVTAVMESDNNEMKKTQKDATEVVDKD